MAPRRLRVRKRTRTRIYMAMGSWQLRWGSAFGLENGVARGLAAKTAKGQVNSGRLSHLTHGTIAQWPVTVADIFMLEVGGSKRTLSC